MAQYKYPLSSFSIDENRINLSGLATSIQEAIESKSINTVYDAIERADGYVNIYFRSSIDENEKSALDLLVLNHSGGDIKPFAEVHLDEKRDSEDRLVMVTDVRTGSEVVLATHNFCDPCTWYSESARTSETLSMLDDGYSFGGTNKNWIDISNGRILKEDSISETISHGYKVKIIADGLELVEQTVTHHDPGTADYVVNYEDGYVTFLQRSYAGSVIEADYSYATGSGWYLIPFDNKKVRIERAEVQFSEDVGFTDAIEMIFYFGNPSANSASWQEYKKVRYKTMDNFIDEAEGAFPQVPPLTGIGGTKKARYGFPFRYSTARSISSGLGMFLVVRLVNNRKLDGERSTATFYCTIVDE